MLENVPKMESQMESKGDPKSTFFDFGGPRGVMGARGGPGRPKASKKYDFGGILALKKYDFGNMLHAKS